MKNLIVPLTKSPHQKGRIGLLEMQDWYQGIVKAKKLLEILDDSKILVACNFQVKGGKSEADIYENTLNILKVDKDDIIVIREGLETIGQIELIKKIAGDLNTNLVFISTFLHYPRVRYLCRGMKARHIVAFGIPRPKEIITDIILAILFPVIDLLGKKEWFAEKVQTRRKKGQF